MDALVSLEAAAGFVLAALCCLYLIQIALEASTAARKVGAMALAVVCGGLALEALLYLSQAPAVGGSFTRSAAVLFVRSALLLSAGLIGALLWRAPR
ncbi:MAG TPA: hypothetical protein VI759_09315 [Dehalococcoidia bacterium]|nr:hypothetical protein [Dehalococcoidia bacterium]